MAGSYLDILNVLYCVTDLSYSCVTLVSCVQNSVQPAKIGIGPTFLKLRVPIKALQANLRKDTVLTALSLFVLRNEVF